MDTASAELVEALARELPLLPWLVVVSRRDRETGFTAAPGEHVAAPRARAARAGRVARAGRGRTEAAPLPPHIVELAAERSGGSPQFLRDLLRAAAAGSTELPDSIESAALARLDRLARARPRADPARVGARPELPPAPARRPARRRRPRARRRTRGRRLGALLQGRGRRPPALPPRGGARRRLRRPAVPRPARAARGGGRAGSSATSGTDADEPPRASRSTSTAPAMHEKAWRYARLAADRASERSAFADAADLYRRALDVRAPARRAARRAGRRVGVARGRLPAHGRARAQRPRAHQRAPPGRRRPGAHRAPAVAAREHRLPGRPHLARGALVGPGAAHARARVDGEAAAALPRRTWSRRSPPCASARAAPRRRSGSRARRSRTPRPPARSWRSGMPARSSTGRSSCPAAQPRPGYSDARAGDLPPPRRRRPRVGRAQQHGRLRLPRRALGRGGRALPRERATRACARATSTSAPSRTATSARCSPTRAAWRRPSRCCAARCRSGAAPPTSTASRSRPRCWGACTRAPGAPTRPSSCSRTRSRASRRCASRSTPRSVKALLAEAALFDGRAEEAHERALALFAELPDGCAARAAAAPRHRRRAGADGRDRRRRRATLAAALDAARASRAAARDGARARRARARSTRSPARRAERDALLARLDIVRLPAPPLARPREAAAPAG